MKEPVPINDYKCEGDHTTEDVLVPTWRQVTKTIPCPVCGLIALRLPAVSHVDIFDNLTGGLDQAKVQAAVNKEIGRLERAGYSGKDFV